MTRCCVNCGSELPDDVAFCTECGTPAPKNTPAAEPGQAPAAPVQERFAPPPPPAPVPPPADPAAVPAARQQTVGFGPISTGYYFWMTLVYALPVLGFLVCLIVALSAKNPSKKHHATATLIWMLVGLVLAVILFFVGRWALGQVKEFFTQSSGWFSGFDFGLPANGEGLDDLLGILESMQ